MERFIKGKDGLVRAADIKTSTGYTSRPITKQYPLEVTLTTHRKTKPSQSSELTKSSKPVRRTAQVAREKQKNRYALRTCG